MSKSLLYSSSQNVSQRLRHFAPNCAFSFIICSFSK
ncbi:unnamed protein product [Brugia timori]|uniref:Uncharacterized protein n=1 Tax=Brugia timori TaxID=42155 RepID=A0A0R3QA16_9BILA|nr:unnamed protein product [Brugia timori]